MTLSRWKIMTCILGLSVGGLAVCAGQSNNQLHKSEPKQPSASSPTVSANPSKPAVPPTAGDTLPPAPGLVLPAGSTDSAPMQEFELDLPVLTEAPPAPPMIVVPAPKAGGIIKAAGHEPSDPLPAQKNAGAPPIIPAPAPSAKGTVVPEPARIASPPAGDVRVKEAEKVRPLEFQLETARPPVPTPPAIDPFIAPKQANEVKPKVDAPLVQTPAASPKVPSENVPDPLIPAPPVKTVTTPSRPQAAPPTASPQKLKMLLRLGSGMPRFEIRTAAGEEMLLKVYAEKIEMKNAPEAAKASPLAGVTACGKVKFVGSGIEGTCDELTILSGTGEVMLKGNVHMKTKMKAKGSSELTADKMIYQIGTSGMMTPASTNRSTFTPVEYHENH